LRLVVVAPMVVARVLVIDDDRSLVDLLSDYLGRLGHARQIVTAVWGAEFVEETDYIRRHVWHLRQKPARYARHPRHILNERGVGYVSPAET
jgi:two-component system, OmpR family, KDP operon response regulator KdpE